MIFRLVKHFLPSSWEALEEFSLSQLPHRIDIVILRRHDGAPLGPFEIRGLNALFSRFQDPAVQHALIEVKAPNDGLEDGDLFQFLGHANLYVSFRGIRDPGEVVLITLSDGISEPFQEQVKRIGGRFTELAQEPGVWEVDGLMFGLYCIDARVASRTPGNHLLYPFTREFLVDPRSMVGLLTPEEEVFFIYLCQQVVQ